MTLLLAALAPLGSAQTLVYSLPGPVTDDHWGYRVAVVGDIDGDLADDFLLTAPGWGNDAGAVVLRSGKTGAQLDLMVGAAGQLLGSSLAVIGDIDNDNVADWIVGRPMVGVRGSGFTSAPVGPGGVWVISGATQSIIRGHLGSALGGAFGHSVGGGEDVDGDGVPDYIVGSPVLESAEIFSGSTGNLIQTIASFGLETGYAVALVPDLDNDSLADAVVSMTQGFSGFPAEVRAFKGTTGALLWTHGGGIGSETGWLLLATDDVNSDGVPDVLSVDRQWGNSFAALGKGRLEWLSGATGGVLHFIQGTSPNLGAGFGLGLTHLGDLDGDGLRDLAVGSPGLYESTGFAYPGEDLQFLQGWPPANAGSLSPPVQDETFAQGLASGDFDGDGITDLVLGAPRDDGTQATAGMVRVYTRLTDPQVYCTSQPNTQGCVPRAWWTGTASFAASTMRVRAADILNNKFGVLFWGPGPAQLPFGGGTLCVGPSVKRTSAQFSAGNSGPADCSGTFAYQFTSVYLAAEGLTPGTTVFCQYWSRDPAHASGFNVTDAVLFTVLP